MFAGFLRKDMTESCWVWLPTDDPKSQETLHGAQEKKLDRFVDNAKIEAMATFSNPELAGSFAIQPVEKTGCRRTSLTLSRDHKELAESSKPPLVMPTTSGRCSAIIDCCPFQDWIDATKSSAERWWKALFANSSQHTLNVSIIAETRRGHSRVIAFPTINCDAETGRLCMVQLEQGLSRMEPSPAPPPTS